MSKASSLILATLLCIACSKQATAPQPLPLDALWSTQSVNGASLPAVVRSGEELLQRRYALTLTSSEGGTFIQYVTLRFNGVDTVSGSNSGTFTVTDSKIAFHYAGTTAVDTGTWNGADQIRLFDGPDLYLLAR